MPRTSRIVLCLLVLASAVSATGSAQARGGFNRDCQIPRLNLCPDCTVSARIVVLQNHACHIDYHSLTAIHPQKILVGPKHGRYWAINESSTLYSPGKGYLGSDYFETKFAFEKQNGNLTSATLKAAVEVVPHF